MPFQYSTGRVRQMSQFQTARTTEKSCLEKHGSLGVGDVTMKELSHSSACIPGDLLAPRTTR